MVALPWRVRSMCPFFGRCQLPWRAADDRAPPPAYFPAYVDNRARRRHLSAGPHHAGRSSRTRHWLREHPGDGQVASTRSGHRKIARPRARKRLPTLFCNHVAGLARFEHEDPAN